MEQAAYWKLIEKTREPEFVEKTIDYLAQHLGAFLRKGERVLICFPCREEYSLILQCLEKKALISIDYGKPLVGADMSAYKGYPVHGSFALTERGQQVLEMLEVQGVN